MSHIQEAVAQWAWAYGSEHPDQAWVLSDYDTWERNPHYTGPETRHPEDYDYGDETEVAPVTDFDTEPADITADIDDDIPF